MAEVDVLPKPREAAAALGVSYPTIKHWILAGKLKTVKTPGGHHRVPQSALTPLMKSKATPSQRASRERFRNVSGRNQLVGKIIEVQISGLLAKVVSRLATRRLLRLSRRTPSARCSFARGRPRPP